MIHRRDEIISLISTSDAFKAYVSHTTVAGTVNRHAATVRYNLQRWEMSRDFNNFPRFEPLYVVVPKQDQNILKKSRNYK